ncbi:MAG: hypothetical protein QFB87_05590, partial [Patescibacteria group bacterium]|nr:hypothetical protein [Patescibacteria group bacterium]
ATGLTINNEVNSTTAFQIQNAAASALLTADTVNQRLGVNVTYSAMAAPTQNVTSTSTTGGTLAATTYYYKITAVDSAGGETAASVERSQVTTGATSTVTLSWVPVTGASGYRIYRGTTALGGANSEVYLTNTLGTVNATNLNYIDTGSMNAGTGAPPASNTAYTSTNVSNSKLQLALGGNGTPTGQLYVGGTTPTAAVSIITSLGNSNSGIVAQGRYAYVSDSSSNTFAIVDISSPTSPVIVGSVNNFSTCRNGSGVKVQGKYAYIYGSGAFLNFCIYDVSNPTNPTLVYQSPNNVGGLLYVSGRYLYTVTPNSRLQIWDISNPAAPIPSGSVATSANSSIQSVQGRYAYAISTSANNLQIFDISNPAAPVTAGTASVTTNTLAAYVQGRYAYVVDSGAAALDIFDISNPASSTKVGTVGVANILNVSVSGRYAYTTSTNGVFRIYDISNPINPFITGTYDTLVGSSLAGYVQGRYAYLGSTAGFQVYDLGGAYVQQLEVGDTETGSLQVNGNTGINGSLSLQGGFTTGSSAQVAGNLGVGGGANIQGSTVLTGGQNNLTAPTTPTVAPQGTTGAQRWDYTVTAVNAYGGETVASTAGTTATGNATLGAVNYNLISWSAVSGATAYKIYRTYVTGATSPTTTGYIGSTTSTSFNDIGLNGTVTASPTTDTTAQLTVQGAALFKNASDSTSAFQVQNAAATPVMTVDTTNAQLVVRGAASTAVLGAELSPGNDYTVGANWTTTGWTTTVTNATHTTGNTSPLIDTQFAVTGGATYQVNFSTTGFATNTEYVTPQIGGNTGQAVYGNSNESQIITAVGTGTLRFTPTSNWNGIIGAVSVKVLTKTKPVLTAQNSTGTAALEVRASGVTTSTFIGLSSGEANTSGNYNTGYGNTSLQSNTNGNNNTASGYASLQSNSGGSYNTAMGFQALQLNTTGNNNTAVGNVALGKTTTGTDNTAVGSYSLQNNTGGYQNTAIGRGAMNANTTGLFNTALGYNSLSANLTGNNNTAIGLGAVSAATTAGNNTGVGYYALFNATTGGANTSLGVQSLYDVSTGTGNVGIGYKSGLTSISANTNTTGANNTFIGNQSGPGVASAAALQNATAIGYLSAVSAHDTLALGCTNGTNGCSTSTKISINSAGYANSPLTVSNIRYSTGTITASGTTAITGTSTVWTSAMVGGKIYFTNSVGTYTSDTITAVGSNTTLTTAGSNTITAGATYVIAYAGLNISSTGALSLQNTADSTTAFQLQNAAGTSNLIVADTTNTKIGIGVVPITGGGILQVSGNLSVTGSVEGKGGTAATQVFGGWVTGDSVDRYQVTAGGAITWGPGNAATDISLSRSGVGGLTVQSTTNSTTAFQIQNSGNSSLFTVDTSANVVKVALGSTASTTAVCSSLAAATAPTASTAYELRDCSGAPVADYAESYPVAAGTDYGDIVSVGSTMVNTYEDTNGTVDWTRVKSQITQLVKSSSPYQSNTIGIVSNNYNNFTSAGYNIKPEDNPKPIALNGRVPVKISAGSAAILPGDYLTTSTDPGKATMATGAGYVIGKAIAAWDPASGAATVMVYVEPGYYGGPSQTSLVQNGSSATLTGLNVTGTADFADINVSGMAKLQDLKVVGAVAIGGNLTVTGLVSVVDLKISGHIITAGQSPTAQVVSAVAGGTASSSVEGNDTLGTISFVSSTNPQLDDTIKVTFKGAYSKTPKVLISAANADAARIQFFRDNTTSTEFTIKFGSQLAPNTTYKFDYFTAE